MNEWGDKEVNEILKVSQVGELFKTSDFGENKLIFSTSSWECYPIIRIITVFICYTCPTKCSHKVVPIDNRMQMPANNIAI